VAVGSQVYGGVHQKVVAVLSARLLRDYFDDADADFRNHPFKFVVSSQL